MAEANSIENLRNSRINDMIIVQSNNVKQSGSSHQTHEADSNPSISVDEALKLLEEKLKKLSELFRGEAQFSFDKEIDRVIIKIKDKETGEIIRQIPPEVAVKIAKKVDELIGILFDELA